MTSEFYEAFEDPYTYPGTNVLKNKLGIRDAGKLESFELEMAALRADEPLPRGRLSPTHYRNIHHFLFQDVYGWAGRYRSVRMAKDENAFCYPENIDQEMRKHFGSLRDAKFLKGMPAGHFSRSAAIFLAELNAIHPFREGNGRTQTSFLAVLADAAGHPIDLTFIRRETFLPAMVMSFAGDIEPLEKEIRRMLR